MQYQYLTDPPIGEGDRNITVQTHEKKYWRQFRLNGTEVVGKDAFFDNIYVNNLFGGSGGGSGTISSTEIIWTPDQTSPSSPVFNSWNDVYTQIQSNRTKGLISKVYLSPNSPSTNYIVPAGSYFLHDVFLMNGNTRTAIGVNQTTKTCTILLESNAVFYNLRYIEGISLMFTNSSVSNLVWNPSLEDTSIFTAVETSFLLNSNPANSNLGVIKIETSSSSPLHFNLYNCLIRGHSTYFRFEMTNASQNLIINAYNRTRFENRIFFGTAGSTVTVNADASFTTPLTVFIDVNFSGNLIDSSKNMSYDNSTSGLTSITVKEAIDELASTPHPSAGRIKTTGTGSLYKVRTSGSTYPAAGEMLFIRNGALVNDASLADLIYYSFVDYENINHAELMKGGNGENWIITSQTGLGLPEAIYFKLYQTSDTGGDGLTYWSWNCLVDLTFGRKGPFNDGEIVFMSHQTGKTAVQYKLGELANLDAAVDTHSAAEDGHVLAWDYNASHWTNKDPATIPPAPHDLTSHTDATITAPVNNDMLQYNGSQWINHSAELNRLTDVNYNPLKMTDLGYLRWDIGQNAFVEAKAYITDTLGGDYIIEKTTYTGGSVITGKFSYDLTAKKLRLAKTSLGVFGDGGATAIHRPHPGDILTFRKEYASDSNIKFRVLTIVDIGGPDWNISVQLISDNDNGVSGDYYIYTMEKHSADKWIFNINPTPTNDFANGYLVGDLWINTDSDTTYICVNNTTGSAIWKDVSNSGLNVGTGAKVYKDTTGDGINRFRTLTNTDGIITITELTNTIDLNIDALKIPSTLGDLNDVTLAGLAKEDLLVYDVGTSSWVNKPVEDIGLVSNGINLGLGEGVFVDKDNLTLRFKSIASTDGSLKVTTTLDNEIDLSVDNSVLGFVTDGANIGKGEGIFTNKLDGVLQFKNLLSADGAVTINNSVSGTDIEFGINPLAINISQFSDMNITLPIAEGELLFANGTTGKWENRLPVLNDMSDVDTGKVTTDDILIFNGSNWTAASKDIYFGNTYGHTYNYFNTAPVGDVTNGNLHLDGTTIYISTIDQYGKDLQVSGSFPFININNILVFQQANNAFVYMKIFPDNLTRAGTPPNTYWTGQVIIGSDDSVNLNVGFTGRLTCQPVHIKHLNDIEDVNTGKSDISDYLGWDDASGKWINRRVNLNDIVDVTTTAPQVGDYIRYSGTTWENTQFPMGSMYWRNNVTATTITTQKTILTDNSNFYKVAGTSILKLSTLFDMPANNRIRYLGSDRHFHVVCQFSAICATNDRIAYFTLVKNEGTTPEYDNIVVSTNLHSDRDNGHAIHTDIMLLANDTLSLHVANTETTDSITIKFMYLYLMGM